MYTKNKLGVSSTTLIVTLGDCKLICNTMPIGVPGLDVSDAEAVANAERLVKCWNNHDALLDVAKAQVARITGGSKYPDFFMEDEAQLLKQAQAAISAATNHCPHQYLCLLTIV